MNRGLSVLSWKCGILYFNVTSLLIHSLSALYYECANTVLGKQVHILKGLSRTFYSLFQFYIQLSAIHDKQYSEIKQVKIIPVITSLVVCYVVMKFWSFQMKNNLNTNYEYSGYRLPDVSNVLIFEWKRLPFCFSHLKTGHNFVLIYLDR